MGPNMGSKTSSNTYSVRDSTTLEPYRITVVYPSGMRCSSSSPSRTGRLAITVGGLRLLVKIKHPKGSVGSYLEVHNQNTGSQIVMYPKDYTLTITIGIDGPTYEIEE